LASQILSAGIYIAREDNGYFLSDPQAEAGIGQFINGQGFLVDAISYNDKSRQTMSVRRALDADGSWIPTGDWGGIYSLATDGSWIEDTDFVYLPTEFGGPQGDYTVDFYGACMTVSRSRLAHKTRLCFDEIELEGKSVLDILIGFCGTRDALSGSGELCRSTETSMRTETFPSNSLGFEISTVYLEADRYRLEVPRRIADRQGHYGNPALRFGGVWSGTQPVTSIADFLELLVRVKDDLNFEHGLPLFNGLSIKVRSYDAQARSGHMEWLFSPAQQGAPVAAGLGRFWLERVHSVDVLVVEFSSGFHRLQPGDWSGSALVFAAHEGEIWSGFLERSGFKWRTSFGGPLIGNRAMLDSLRLHFNRIGRQVNEFPSSFAQ